MGCSRTDHPPRYPGDVTEDDVCAAYERFRAEEIDPLTAAARPAVARLRGFEMRVEDAEDVLSAAVLEAVKAAQAGAIVVRGDETPAQAAHRRMRMPVRNRVIDRWRARKRDDDL